MSSEHPVHALQAGTAKPLTVWRCTCGVLEVGDPRGPFPTRPREHSLWNHVWAPVTQAEADEFLTLLSNPVGAPA
jgi:hypothetical protein